ncbi:MAG: hypothetical protein DWP98_07275 [Bacteroidetes bacterium]|nr:MAG: hypothetical protein DWP98_07275 [Bacteroidota bacterium]MBL1143708.1 hypothetical protein [Bacteroidota bacterium]MCB0802082.1 hypothetical protein [Flavobacteriales bacterium]NOG56510.1 hypothetical protein [Bacteroidota bacterium]
MNTIELLRARINNMVNVSQNKAVLKELDKILKKAVSEEVYQLSDAENELLNLAEEDIKYGRVISQEELDKKDDEWMV